MTGRTQLLLATSLVIMTGGFSAGGCGPGSPDFVTDTCEFTVINGTLRVIARYSYTADDPIPFDPPIGPGEQGVVSVEFTTESPEGDHRTHVPIRFYPQDAPSSWWWYSVRVLPSCDTAPIQVEGDPHTPSSLGSPTSFDLVVQNDSTDCHYDRLRWRPSGASNWNSFAPVGHAWDVCCCDGAPVVAPSTSVTWHFGIAPVGQRFDFKLTFDATCWPGLATCAGTELEWLDVVVDSEQVVLTVP